MSSSIIEEMNRELAFNDLETSDLLDIITRHQKNGTSDFVTDVIMHYAHNGPSNYFISAIDFHILNPLSSKIRPVLLEFKKMMDNGDRLTMVLELNSEITYLGCSDHHGPGRTIYLNDPTFYTQHSMPAAICYLERTIVKNNATKFFENAFALLHHMSGRLIQIPTPSDTLTLKEAKNFSDAIVTTLNQVAEMTMSELKGLCAGIDFIEASEDHEMVKSALMLTDNLFDNMSNLLKDMPESKAVSDLTAVVNKFHIIKKRYLS